MPLDPEARRLLDALDAAQPLPPEQLGVEASRRQRREREPLAVPADVERTEDRTVTTPEGPVTVRLYWPTGGAGALPMLVWFHGGGFVFGDLDTADATARELCQGAAVIVASVDYPLAPEHPFPAAPRACWAVTSWLAGNAGELGADPTRLAVGGDSAGGNLAAVTALMARESNGPPLAFQLLVYPVTDLLGSFPSVRQNAEGYGLTAATMEWFCRQYAPDPQAAKDPVASPIYAEDLAGLPAALVITAEYDPLRDEGEAYGERLRLAGTKATVSRYEGMIHGFFAMTAELEGGRRAMAEAVAALRTSLA